MLTTHCYWRRARAIAVGLLATVALITSHSIRAVTPAGPILVSQAPLTVAIPAHPQIVLALANSQSMDGNLSGAIMTGSGSLPGTLGANLAASSSPVNYSIPTGFTPPVNPGSGGQAPYTANGVGTTLVDNSPSRMNVAKEGVTAILNSFMPYADFALLDYSTSSVQEFTTWAYYMSQPSSGFTFTSTAPGGCTIGVACATLSGGEYVANPCYGADVMLPDSYSQSCAVLETYYGSSSGVLSQYLIVGASGDDPQINDVLFAAANFEPPVCVDAGPYPTNPYATFNLASYNIGGVNEIYETLTGPAPTLGLGNQWACGPGMAPTNAGYVPSSPEVMQVERGFGYDAGSQSPAGAAIVLPMQSSGGAPTPTSIQSAIGMFTPFLQPETNDQTTTEIKSSAEQAPIAGLVQGATQYFSTANPPSTNTCTPSRYIVLVTDGLPTEDLNGNSWPPIGSAAAAGYGETASFNPDGSLAGTDDQALLDTISQIHLALTQGIKTYVIGLGAGVDPANNMQASQTLTAMAVAGGTGSYFAATSPGQLTTDMQQIVAQILAVTSSDASATINTTSLNTSSMAFQPSFKTSDTYQDWTGNIQAYAIDPATGAVSTTATWSAQALLDTQNWKTERVIATWDPLANGGLGGGIPFRWTPGTTATSGIASTTQLGADLTYNTSDPIGWHALEYLRGDRNWEIRNGGSYRNRSHVLADIVDSAPLYIAAPSGPYQTASYSAFENQYSTRPSVLYAGANDGMLHAFNALTGAEMFAYIPNGVFTNLINLTNPYYNEDHLFYADGPPQAADVQFDSVPLAGTWHTVLVSGERAGGNSVFALDVTNPLALSSEHALANSVLWEFSDANMGLSFSTPAIVQTASGTSGPNLSFTVFFGNGYNSPSEMPYLYALDPQTGAQRAPPINLCNAVPSACNAALPNGLSSVTVVNSGGAIGAPATTLYAGDLQGNLWRVDIHGAPSTWTVNAVTLLFQALDPYDSPQPITTAPAVSLNPNFPHLLGTMVYVGTGQLLGTPDLSSMQVQSMYGIYDSGSNSGTLNRFDTSMAQQCISANQVGGQTLRFVTAPVNTVCQGTATGAMAAGAINLQTGQQGWYADFKIVIGSTDTDVGERIVTNPVLVGGALAVISVQPSPSSQSVSITQPHTNLLASKSAASKPARSIVARTHRQSRGGHSRGDRERLASLEHADPAPTLADHRVDAAQMLGAPQLSAPYLSSTQAQPMHGGLYYPSESTAHLWPTVGGSELTSIVVTPTSQTIDTGGNSQPYVAYGVYTNEITGVSTTSTTPLTGVDWSTSDDTVATIGANGVASASATMTGTITITATLGTASGTAMLTVDPTPPAPVLTGIYIEPSNDPSIVENGSLQFIAYGIYTSGSTVIYSQTPLSGVAWSSGSPSIASIGANGVATGVSPGPDTITGTYMGLPPASAPLTVIPPPIPGPPATLSGCTISPQTSTIYVGGATAQFSVTAVYSDGSRIANPSASWTFVGNGVASVSTSGLATSSAGPPGTATITATVTTQTPTPATVQCSANLVVLALPVLEQIIVTPATDAIQVGQTVQYQAEGIYSSGPPMNLTDSVIWSSSVPGTASISNLAGMQGVAKGLTTSPTGKTTIITATLSGSPVPPGTATLEVIPAPTLVSITVSPPTHTNDIGDMEAYTATGNYVDINNNHTTQPLTNLATWTSSNNLIATIAPGGLSTSRFTGAVTISARYGGQTGTAQLTVDSVAPTAGAPVCPGGAIAYLMEFNFAGGAFNVPVFNYNMVGTPASSLLPANGVLLGNVYASAPVFSNFSGSITPSGSAIGFVTLSSGTIESFWQLGLPQRRFSWVEIR